MCAPLFALREHAACLGRNQKDKVTDGTWKDFCTTQKQLHVYQFNGFRWFGGVQDALGVSPIDAGWKILQGSYYGDFLLDLLRFQAPWWVNMDHSVVQIS